MHLSAVGGVCLLFLPLAAAVHGPPHGNVGARDLRRNEHNNHPRAIVGLGPPDTATTQTTPTTSSPPPPPTQTTPTTSSTSTSAQSVTTTTATTPSSTSTTPTSTSVPSTTAPPVASTRSVSTNQNGQLTTVTVQVPGASSSSSTSTSATASSTADSDSTSSGPSEGTYIGLGVAGGVALLGLVGFIVWKFTQKRFSQFDDDGADINWPMPKEALVAPTAPAMSAANTTTSSVDLTADPYAVPPLPPRSATYYDDPSGTAAAAYYDPYRGPVPQTFHSPPGSVDSHAQQYAMGEAIAMSTYPSTTGHQSSGSNAAYDDPYSRSRSPGPNMAYEDPYTGRRSPGPSLAYGMDPARTGTPANMAPPRMGTPLGGPGGYAPPPPPGFDVPRTGTPQSYGRASSGMPAAYAAQQPLPNPYGRGTPNPYGS